MELEGVDISHLEPSIQFHTLGKPPTTKGAMPPTIEAPPNDKDEHTENTVDITQMTTIEIPSDDPLADVPFSDRLSACKDFWEQEIKAPRHILDALDNGVDIGLIPDIENQLPPEGIWVKNRSHSPPEEDALRNQVEMMLARGLAQKTYQNLRPRICLGLFLEQKPDGRYRILWNGKPLTDFLIKTEFSYEQLRRFLEGITDLSILGKLDLVDGFFAIKVKACQRTYLGFSIYNRSTKMYDFYEFLVLPQGIMTAPYIFSRFTLAITTYLRRTIMEAIFLSYLDDLGWAIEPSTPRHRIRVILITIRDAFLKAGWVLSTKKSLFDALLQALVLLGVLISTNPILSVDIPPESKSKLLALVNTTIIASHHTPRVLMSIAGSLQSREVVLGPSTTLFLRYTYGVVAHVINADLCNKKLWDHPFAPDSDSVEELTHWKKVLESTTTSVYRKPIWLIESSDIKKTGFTDASGMAVGGIAMNVDPAQPQDIPKGEPYWFDKHSPCAGEIFEKHGHQLSVKMLTPEQRKESSTLREFLGVIHLTEVHVITWSGNCIRIFVDNAAVVKVFRRGSSIRHLHKLARELVALLKKYDIRLVLVWIPRVLNMGADLMSRQFRQAFTDIEDYRLSVTAFSSLQSLYGHFSIDMFANADNAKCPRFVSRHADVGSLPGSIDAFYQPSWGTSFYAFPPVDDAYRALEHILAQPNARGVLVLPLWVRLSTYHRLFPDGNHFIPQVTGWHLLSLTDLEKGFGHASFLSPNKGGHKTPFYCHTPQHDHQPPS